MQLVSSPLIDIADPLDKFIINFVGIGGDDSASDLNVDGDTVPQFAWWVSEDITIVSSINLIIMDNNGWQIDGFGGLGVLDNGLRLAIVDDPTNEASANEVGPGLTMQQHHDWSVITAAGDIHELRSNDGRGVYSATWMPHKTLGRPLRINAGGGVLVTIQDDLSSLSFFKILINGIRPR